MNSAMFAFGYQIDIQLRWKLRNKIYIDKLRYKEKKRLLNNKNDRVS